MPIFTSFGSRRLTKAQKYSTAGLAVSAAALTTVAAVPGLNGAGSAGEADAKRAAAAYTVKAADVQGQKSPATLNSDAVAKAVAQPADTAVKTADTKQDSIAAQAKNSSATAKTNATADEATKKAAAEKMAKAKKEYAEKHSADNKTEKQYPDNLDGWIREALDIMKREGIPGTYEGIYRNIMRESSGNPRAINTWDINAQNGVPSKGLLQVIWPTFKAYHVEGTSWDQYDPVANIVAACNYAADRYGTIDNVDSAY